MHQIRRFDDLGRIAIPKEMREAVIHAKITEGVQMDVDVFDGAIVLKPHKPKDMVEVVRCKDCKHYDEEFCHIHDGYIEDDDYCSYGARMDGGSGEQIKNGNSK